VKVTGHLAFGVEPHATARGSPFGVNFVTNFSVQFSHSLCIMRAFPFETRLETVASIEISLNFFFARANFGA
jgi:hypothetical protein